ncbi:hypothetical protein GCM10010320_26990 [Streptomyces caelestis]|nr:hypothetical protein GCM10010320_26990 [Streptomyces caelestis]
MRSGASRRNKAHDLRRAWTPIDTIRPRRKGLGGGDADLGARRRPGRSGGGRRLCVRLDGAGRHGGGGGRRKQDLADQATVPDTRTDPHAHAHAHPDTPTADTDTGPDAVT